MRYFGGPMLMLICTLCSNNLCVQTRKQWAIV